MYLDSLVKIPVVPGRITYRPKASATYVEYLIENVYDPKVKYSRPTRKAIGKLSKSDPGMMQPNENRGHVGIMENDCLIVDSRVSKYYSISPRYEISISFMDKIPEELMKVLRLED